MPLTLAELGYFELHMTGGGGGGGLRGPTPSDLVPQWADRSKTCHVRQKLRIDLTVIFLENCVFY